jgi:glyoxylase-like metal-dependent hydrolase (beta-lactamase superfamily II)
MIHVEQHGPVVAIRMARGVLGRPLMWSTAYWVDGLLIDTGPACTADQLVHTLRRVKVETVVLTHSHEDVIGGLHAVHAAFPAAPIFASWYALPIIEQPARLRLQLYRRLVWGSPLPVDAALPLEKLEDTLRTRAYTFRLVETPGHTRDAISLFEPQQRWLFAGDAYIGGSERAWSRETDMSGVLGSLHTLAGLRPERLFPCSGEVRRNPRPELADKIDRLQRLCREVARLEVAGLSVAEMAACLFQHEPWLAWWSGGHYSAANLIQACRTYNALLAVTEPESSAVAKPRRSRPLFPKSRDSSPNESADRGDVVR